MERIYFYKLTADSGGAPCVERGLLSLAICKPIIRKKANEGDLIFGFAASSLHLDNRLIYIARVTKVARNGEYFTSRKYARRGDCIYALDATRFVWRSGALHHGPKDMVHDLGRPPDYPRANVLLSEDFRYFGKAGGDDYKRRFPRVKYAVEHLGQGFRVHHSQALRQELLHMASWVWQRAPRKVMGQPTSAPSRRICHRARPCGVI